MSDVARHAGVALGTVSNTLNNPDKVSDATRRRVQAAIAELGFVRNDAARSLAAGSSTSVGLVLADLGNSFFVDIARGVETVMRRHGMDVLIVNTDVEPAREVHNLELLERSRVAGIIIAPLDTQFAKSGPLPTRATPTVLVNYESPALAYSGVIVDERHGGALAAQHLLSLGRRRLLFVGGPLFLTAVAGRWEGVQQVVAGTPDATVTLEETRGVNIRHGRE
ncbi:MAG TPA: LacI family DNA-binding transcriptional regulator, partial [Microbacterium sp.]|nr:LacI family DNA-binding transcriptional regulator [Microbacterium sp.]